MAMKREAKRIPCEDGDQAEPPKITASVICFHLCSPNVFEPLPPSAFGDLLDGGVMEVWGRCEMHRKAQMSGQPTVGERKVKPIKPSGISRFQEDAYRVLQFCRIRIAAVRNDFLR
jgi:hypothetical protein